MNYSSEFYYEESSGKTYFIKSFYKDFFKLRFKNEETLLSEEPKEVSEQKLPFEAQKILYKKEAYEIDSTSFIISPKPLKVMEFNDQGVIISSITFKDPWKIFGSNAYQTVSYGTEISSFSFGSVTLERTASPPESKILSSEGSNSLRKEKRWYNEENLCYQVCYYTYTKFEGTMYLQYEDYYMKEKSEAKSEAPICLVLRIVYNPEYSKYLGYNCQVEYLYFEKQSKKNYNFSLAEDFRFSSEEISRIYPEKRLCYDNIVKQLIYDKYSGFGTKPCRLFNIVNPEKRF